MILLVFGALILLLKGTQILASGMGNAAMIAYLAEISRSYVVPSADPVARPVRLNSAGIDGSLDLLERAVDLAPESPSLNWGLMRVSLLSDRDLNMTPSINDYLPEIASNTGFYQDLLLSFSLAGRHDQVITLFEAVQPPHMTDTIRDAVALAHFESGDASALNKASQLRPDDLYVNYSLWRIAQESGDEQQADQHRRALEHFALPAIFPTDFRLITHAATVIPDLYGDGIWDKEQTVNVVAFLVWQDRSSTASVPLTESLSQQFPSDPDWLFYQAEVQHRIGQFERAEELYRQVVSLDPDYAAAYFRLGMIAESQSQVPANASSLDEAVALYGHYNALKGDDLLGLKKLAGLCAEVSSKGDAEDTCRTGTDYRFVASLLGAADHPETPVELDIDGDADLPAIVAALFNLGEAQLTLGPNLIENGEFENWVIQGQLGMTRVPTRPHWWIWTEMFDRAPFNDALFVGGPDELSAFEGTQAARVDGLWVKRDASQEPARAGFWQRDEQTLGLRQIELPPNRAYLLSFVYRTERIADGRVTAWTASGDEPGSLSAAGDRLLPATDGAWYRFVAVGWNHSHLTAYLQPLLRLYATGSVSFDDVVLHSVDFGVGKGYYPDSRAFIVRGPKDGG